jgi:hypothetical protein
MALGDARTESLTNSVKATTQPIQRNGGSMILEPEVPMQLICSRRAEIFELD